MTELEKYLHKPENGELREWLRYLDEKEYNLLEFHFNSFAEEQKKKGLEDVDSKFLNRAKMTTSKIAGDHWIISKKNWNEVINYK